MFGPATLILVFQADSVEGDSAVGRPKDRTKQVVVGSIFRPECIDMCLVAPVPQFAALDLVEVGDDQGLLVGLDHWKVVVGYLATQDSLRFLQAESFLGIQELLDLEWIQLPKLSGVHN